jgi:hypothetical protein
MHLARLAIIVCCGYSVACAHAIVRPTVTAATATAVTPAREALLVLPGVGYSRAGERALRALVPTIAADGFDFYLPTFVARGGLEQSRDRLRRFIREQRLDRYERVHVFAFIAGGWVFNPLAETGALPNLATVVYDRSPYQERAPEVARETLPFLAWVRHGHVIFDLARTRYAPLTAAGVDVGLVVETRPTPFIKRFAATADRRGPYHFACDAFTQRYDDCLYVALNHTELYTHFSAVWPDVRSFIRTGRFTPSANRTPPDLDRRVATAR